MYMISVSRLSVRFPLWRNDNTFFLQAKQIQIFRCWSNCLDCHGRRPSPQLERLGQGLNNPEALPDLYFCRSWWTVASIVIRVGLLFLLRRSVFPSPITGRVWKVTGSPRILMLKVDRSLRWINHSRTDNLSKTFEFSSLLWWIQRMAHSNPCRPFFLKDNVCTVVVCNSAPGYGLFLPVDTAFRRGRFVFNVKSLFTLVFFALLWSFLTCRFDLSQIEAFHCRVMFTWLHSQGLVSVAISESLTDWCTGKQTIGWNHDTEYW